jgi:hypothetical protein
VLLKDEKVFGSEMRKNCVSKRNAQMCLGLWVRAQSQLSIGRSTEEDGYAQTSVTC